ncbi:hypothetical protein QF040_005259 [Variovorax sp. W2I14]
MRQASWSKIVPPHMSDGFSAGGSNESPDTGCVGAVRSPVAAPCGASRSFTGTMGRPLRRSSTKSSPCLVGCTSAGMVSLPTRRSMRLGCEGTS